MLHENASENLLELHENAVGNYQIFHGNATLYSSATSVISEALARRERTGEASEVPTWVPSIGSRIFLLPPLRFLATGRGWKPHLPGRAARRAAPTENGSRANSSTAWKSNSAIFHGMEVKFGGFPRHGRKFREKFHAMEGGLGGFPRHGRRVSMAWKTGGQAGERRGWREKRVERVSTSSARGRPTTLV